MTLYTTLLILSGLLPLRPAPDAPAHVVDAIHALEASEALTGLELGLAVGCAAPQAPLHETGGDRVMNPASGTKLLTTAAVLARFGPNHRFKTYFLGTAPIGGVLAGDLLIRPSGDPSLQGKALKGLAKAIAGAGVAEVRGTVVVDVSAFPDPWLPPAYAQKKTDAAYRPTVPPFGTSDGAVRVTVRPGAKLGDPTRVKTSPAGRAIAIENTSTTSAGKGIGKLTVETAAGADGVTRVIVGGELGRGAPAQGVRRRLADATPLALEELAGALRRAGIKVRGGVKIATRPPAEIPPALGHYESETVAEIISTINIFSNNYWAEALFRLLGDGDGGPFRWTAAASAVERLVTARWGVPDGAAKVVNGSGLYDATRITPIGMVRLLQGVGADPIAGPPFVASLATSGESGTLKRRLKGLAGRVHAKTGTLDHALSLSGYVERAVGCRLAFSVMVGGEIGERAPAVNRAIDGFITELGTR